MTCIFSERDAGECVQRIEHLPDFLLPELRREPAPVQHDQHQVQERLQKGVRR